jgi:hypothetical protein
LLVSVLASSQSGDTVVFDLPLPATITVSLPIVIDRSLNIQGPGADLLTINVSVPGAVLTPGVQVREGHQLMMSGVQLTGTTDPLVDLQPYWNPSIMSLPGRLVLIDAVVKPAVRVLTIHTGAGPARNFCVDLGRARSHFLRTSGPGLFRISAYPGRAR